MTAVDLIESLLSRAPGEWTKDEEDRLSRALSVKPFAGAIGVFDSGAGGISILHAMTEALPQETFVYIGDAAYTPYGNKEEAWVRARALQLSDLLVRGGVKALVVACNTATAVAIQDLREQYKGIPVIGVEPALKVAADAGIADGKILVMATEMTLRLEKYHDLEERLHDRATFTSLPCPFLAGAIEAHGPDAPEIDAMLRDLLGPYRGSVDGIVLGCTHYPLVADHIKEIMGDVPLYDGSEGTARELKRRLGENAVTDGPDGRVLFLTSGDPAVSGEQYTMLFSAQKRRAYEARHKRT